jgi:hypothetical protein
MDDKESYSRGGLIPGGFAVQLVPDDQWDPTRLDQIPYSEGIIHSVCGEVVPAIVFCTGGHECPGSGRE